ncbi:MAG: hypothetical protein K1X29_06705 [Bdellovibrionales bacterium]|nr:hypothetical protein [Bdellovibrionales bacterium]
MDQTHQDEMTKTNNGELTLFSRLKIYPVVILTLSLFLCMGNDSYAIDCGSLVTSANQLTVADQDHFTAVLAEMFQGKNLILTFLSMRTYPVSLLRPSSKEQGSSDNAELLAIMGFGFPKKIEEWNFGEFPPEARIIAIVRTLEDGLIGVLVATPNGSTISYYLVRQGLDKIQVILPE